MLIAGVDNYYLCRDCGDFISVRSDVVVTVLNKYFSKHTCVLCEEEKQCRHYQILGVR